MISVCNRNVKRIPTDDELTKYPCPLLILKHLFDSFLENGWKSLSSMRYEWMPTSVSDFCELKTKIFFRIVINFCFRFFLLGRQNQHYDTGKACECILIFWIRTAWATLKVSKHVCFLAFSFCSKNAEWAHSCLKISIWINDIETQRRFIFLKHFTSIHSWSENNNVL